MHCAGAAAVPGIAAGLYKVRRRDISMRRLFSVRKMRRGGGRRGLFGKKEEVGKYLWGIGKKAVL